jgi:membrane-associated phospholipid phosphatase
LDSILELDARLSSQMRVADKPGALRAIAAFLAHSGDSWFWAIGLLAMWISGDSFWKEWAIVQLGSISLLAVMVLLIKFRIKRKRPEGEWGKIYRLSDPHSFPSGHAARAFQIATIAAGLGPLGLALALWIWAPLVGLARVAMGVHYLSDIVAGALLGIFAALIGLQLYPPLFNWIFGLLGFSLW